MIQGPVIPCAWLMSVVAATGAAEVVPLHDAGVQAYRLSRLSSLADIGQRCTQARLDWALVPPEFKRQRVSLLAMDMDSTLITTECIDELADLGGKKAAVAAITAAAMRGEIDFRESLVRRVALLAGLPAETLQTAYDRLSFSPGAQRLIDGFKTVGTRTLLLSGGFSFFAERLQERLGFDAIAANVLEIADGKLSGRLLGTIVDGKEKAARLTTYKQALKDRGGLSIAIGDGANDLPMLAAADVAIAYRAKPVLRAQARFTLDYCGLDAVLNLFR